MALAGTGAQVQSHITSPVVRSQKIGDTWRPADVDRKHGFHGCPGKFESICSVSFKIATPSKTHWAFASQTWTRRGPQFENATRIFYHGSRVQLKLLSCRRYFSIAALVYAPWLMIRTRWFFSLQSARRLASCGLSSVPGVFCRAQRSQPTC